MSDSVLTTPLTYYVPQEKTSPAFACAFAAGCGGQVAPVETDEGNTTQPVAAFGTPLTWGVFDRARRDGRDWYYGDHALLARGGAVRITRNGYQHIPTAAELANPDHNAFIRMAKDAPAARWRKTGESILICPQSSIYMIQHTGLSFDEWAAQMSVEVRRHSSRPIIVRSKGTKRAISEDLKSAWAVVTYSSGAAVDALLAELPIFVMAPWSTCYPMGTDDLQRLEHPVYPDGRMEFLFAIARRQWTYEELASGYAWNVLRGDAL